MPDRTAPDVRFRLRGLIPVRAGKWAINVNNKKIKFFKTYPCLEIAAAERDAIEQLFGVTFRGQLPNGVRIGPQPAWKDRSRLTPSAAQRLRNISITPGGRFRVNMDRRVTRTFWTLEEAIAFRDAYRAKNPTKTRTASVKCDTIDATLLANYSYCPDTGAVARVFGGTTCGHRNVHGYIRLSVAGHSGKKSVSAHRFAFLWMTGAWPIGVVDHINGDRHDNRWCNLRDVTVEQNASNRLTPGALVTRNGRTYELVPV